MATSWIVTQRHVSGICVGECERDSLLTRPLCVQFLQVVTFEPCYMGRVLRSPLTILAHTEGEPGDEAKKENHGGGGRVNREREGGETSSMIIT